MWVTTSTRLGRFSTMSPELLPAVTDGSTGWQQTVMAFLAEKERRSGSRRTVEGYARMLWPFLSGFESPAQVTPAHVLAWAHGIGLSGREPGSAMVGARIACLSSYYRFLIRMQAASANPCDALERPKGVQSVARGLGADEVRRLLAVVPDTVAGRRDRALLLTFILTGRRRSKVIGLAAGDLNVEGRDGVLQIPRQGWQGRPARAPPSRLRCDRGVISGSEPERPGLLLALCPVVQRYCPSARHFGAQPREIRRRGTGDAEHVRATDRPQRRAGPDVPMAGVDGGHGPRVRPVPTTSGRP
jgi:integrase